MSASRGEKVVSYAGLKYVFSDVPYTGKAATFTVDQSAGAVAVVDPASGPTASLGSASNGTKTVTLAAGGSHIGGRVVVVTSHGKTISSFKPELGGDSVAAP